ncbi:hypothetical protein B0H17DRAFT_1155269 [Mycena rosella]|uniref:Uncharacterized protein n=1 Tax=Mycena rosella TaxID=1033263 RepID=A0AAD7AWI9_MYCRO|nr:hypothetical protein B0H17DRAFT_1155269 [Mycena rosella]
MKSNTDKQLLRFSPLRTSSPSRLSSDTPPRLSRPRDASLIADKENTRYNFIPSVKAPNSLPSMVSMFQLLAHLCRPPRSPMGLKLCRLRTVTPWGGFPSLSKMKQQTKMSGLYGIGAARICGRMMLDVGQMHKVQGIIRKVSCLQILKVRFADVRELQQEEVKPEIKDKAIDTTLPPSDYSNLFTVEKWVIDRMRHAQGEGLSFSTWLQRVQKRIEFLEGLDEHRLRILAEIHLLSRNLE